MAIWQDRTKGAKKRRQKSIFEWFFPICDL